MNRLQVRPVSDRDEWHTLLLRLPTAHILQTWEWGEFKRQTTGWVPERLAYQNAGGEVAAVASLLTRRLGIFSVIYVPKGPVLDYADEIVRDGVLDHLQALARRRHAIWLKIDPDIPVGTGIPTDDTPDPNRPDVPDPVGMALQTNLLKRGWRFSADQVQYRNTLTLDLTQPEDSLFAQMSQSTRRKIRTAEKAGVSVRPADLDGRDFQTLYDLYAVTGERQGFLIRPADYYRQAWTMFVKAGLGYALIAEKEGKPLSGAVLFHLYPKAWYFYGMSSNEDRDLQPNYALQWGAIRWAKAQGYPIYDWWGAPDHFREDDPMWGVYRFKDGFGGTVVRHIGAWDYVPHASSYWLYERLLPRLLKILR
jgi:lipid II:glycine glycyltransferase (peptidoglycan interpeptide bridge formation enzyme)